MYKAPYQKRPKRLTIKILRVNVTNTGTEMKVRD